MALSGDERKLMENFARNVKELMRSREIRRQKHFCEKAGFNPSHFNKLINMNIVPSLGDANRIAEFFGCGLDDLFADRLSEEARTPPPPPDPERDLAMRMLSRLIDRFGAEEAVMRLMEAALASEVALRCSDHQEFPKSSTA